MANSYHVEKPKLMQATNKKYRVAYFKQKIISSIKFLRFIFILLITFLITSYIYFNYVTEVTISDSISLGALLATLGSSIVSICSLFSGQQMDQFKDNTHILYKNLFLDQTAWERWPFVRRIRRYKTNIGYEYQILYNPCIKFDVPNYSVFIDIPSSKSDFYEYSIIKTYLRLKKNRYKYFQGLNEHANPETRKEILIWDCLTAIYKNIINYKAYEISSMVGWGLVLNGLIYSFFYHTFAVKLSLLWCYLKNIIFTIFT